VPDAAQPPRVLRFGSFQVDLDAGELRKGGSKLKLTGQPFQVLTILLERPNQVVTREELHKRLWPDTFVDVDHNLNTAINKIRDALGDTAERPRFVETLARRGYRFIAPVQTQSPQPPVAPPRPTSSPGPSRTIRHAHLLAMAGIAVIVLVLFAAFTAVRGYWRKPGPAGAHIKSLAVLPLENLSRDPEQEYFSDGMTDQLIVDLSKIGTLRVSSSTSSMRYKKAAKSLTDIARELNVDGLIEGSVLRSGDRVRITATLVDVSTDQNLWAETYERDLGDVLKLQADVAQAIAQQVRAQIGSEQQARLRSAPAVNPRAYQAYLKGRFAEIPATRAAIQQAQDYFQEAIREDPSLALAYAGLADCYESLGDYRWLAPKDSYRQASAAVQKALELDEQLGEAHSTVGVLNWRYAWDWQTAERELRHAVDLNRNYVEGHESLVWFLAWSGRRDQALAEIAAMRALDPAFPSLPVDELGVYYHQRDFKSLVELGQKAVAVYPQSWTAHYMLAVGFSGSGRPALAVPEYQHAVELSQADSDPTAGLAHAYAVMGKKTEAEKILNGLQRQSKVGYVSSYMIAAIYSGLGQNDQAFAFLEKAYQERSSDIIYFVRADLRIDPLRSDPRFQDLLRRLALPQMPPAR
jgi:TolB-like protein/DNA-binding winged helix-turn-helix (wHTH) protein/Tfp pilus assembly protein PilF